MDMQKLREAMAAKKKKVELPQEPTVGTAVVVEEKKTSEEVAKEIVTSAADSDILQEPLKPLSNKEPEVFDFIKNIKQTHLHIPIIGSSNSELFLAFPDINPNTLRFTVWSLRKKGYLVDSGIKRKPPKGTSTPQVVWIAAKSLETV